MSNERQERAARAEQMRKDRERAEKRQRNLISIGIIVVVIGLIAAATWAVHSASAKREHNTKLIPPHGATKDYGLVYSPQSIGVKPKADVVRVVLYEDMQCPVCQAFESNSGAFLASEVKNGEIEIEYRLLAFLDDMGRSPNKYGHRAANAAICAYEEGGAKQFKAVHDVLYMNQPQENTIGPDDNALAKRVVSAGVKLKAAEPCVLKNRYVPWVNQSTKQMAKQKVNGTPTVRINGKDVVGAGGGGGAPTLIDLKKAIDDAKAKKS